MLLPNNTVIQEGFAELAVANAISEPDTFFDRLLSVANINHQPLSDSGNIVAGVEEAAGIVLYGFAYSHVLRGAYSFYDNNTVCTLPKLEAWLHVPALSMLIVLCSICCAITLSRVSGSRTASMYVWGPTCSRAEVHCALQISNAPYQSPVNVSVDLEVSYNDHKSDLLAYGAGNAPGPESVYLRAPYGLLNVETGVELPRDYLTAFDVRACRDERTRVTADGEACLAIQVYEPCMCMAAF